MGGIVRPYHGEVNVFLPAVVHGELLIDALCRKNATCTQKGSNKHGNGVCPGADKEYGSVFIGQYLAM